MIQIFAGLFTEGSSDISFLESIVERTITDVAFDCTGQIDIEVKEIRINKSGLNFNDQVLTASEYGLQEFGITLLCVHADADSKTLHDTYLHKIIPSSQELQKQNGEKYCKVLVPIIPIQEMEAWMLADRELLKGEINTRKSDNELGINRDPESYSHPKEVIENAIRIAREGIVKRRRNAVTISDLYLPIGQNIEIEKLERLPSYQDFKRNIVTAFQELNFLPS